MNNPLKLVSHTSGCLVLCIAAALLLSACAAGGGEKNSPVEPMDRIAEPPIVSDAADVPDEEQPSPTDSIEQPAAPNEPIAALPEHGVALYPLEAVGESEEGVLLEIGEKRQRMDWRYTTPRQIMPIMYMSDYDGDGQDELAVVLNIGSGTGVSVDELHIVEFHDVNVSSGEPFVDYMMPAEDYRIQLGEALTFGTINRDGEWFGVLTAGGRTYEVGLSDFLASYEVDAGDIADELGFGSIISFRADAEGLKLDAAVGLIVDGIAEPQYIGTVTATVTYKAGSFTLGEFDYTEEL